MFFGGGTQEGLPEGGVMWHGQEVLATEDRGQEHSRLRAQSDAEAGISTIG